jgi:hypothetical protein
MESLKESRLKAAAALTNYLVYLLKEADRVQKLRDSMLDES